jgi:hypothetical protein
MAKRVVLALMLAGLAVMVSACNAQVEEGSPVGGDQSSRFSGVVSKHPIVEQRSDSLFAIRLTSGEVVEFEDSYGDSWETSWRFTYEEYLDPIAAHLIRIDYYEGGSYLLIGAARGDTSVVDSRPLLSPTAEYFITTSIAGEAGYDPARIRIWQVTSDRFSLVFSHETSGWGFSDPVWQRGDSITVVRHMQTEEVFPSTIQHALSIVLREGTWVLVEDSSETMPPN